MSKQKYITDPIEQIIIDGLVASGIKYYTEYSGKTKNLDFYLPEYDIYIEVKQFHSERINEQMSRANNVICIQGKESAKFICNLLKRINQ